MEYTVLRAILLLSMWGLILACRVDPTKFKRLTMDQMLEAADIVAYGQLNYLEGRNGVYTLYCILKNNDPERPLPDTVTLNVLDRSSASCRSPPVDVTGGVDVLMLLTRQDDGSIIWHDIEGVIPPTTVTYLATSEKLENVIQLAGFQSPVTPQGRDSTTEPKCPDVGHVEILDSEDSGSGSGSLMHFIWAVFLVTLIINAGSLLSWFINL